MIMFLIQSVDHKGQDGSQAQSLETSASVSASGAEQKQSQGDRVYLLYTLQKHLNANAFSIWLITGIVVCELC